MDFRIASTINKMRFASRQVVNLNVNPNRLEFATQTQKSVKVQMVRAKHNLRKAFAQKPDEFTPAQTPDVETVPTRIKELSKLSKHKRKPIIQHKQAKHPKKPVIPFENDTQEILTPLMSKEEEQQWIDIALRNHNPELDFKPIDEHYKVEIEEDNFLYAQTNKFAIKGYKKATRAKTKEYFKDIELDKPTPKKQCKKEPDKIIEKSKNNRVIINLNNRLLWF